MKLVLKINFSSLSFLIDVKRQMLGSPNS